MATFEYQARNANGESVSGLIDAPSENVALETLHKKNFMVIGVHERTTSALLSFKFGNRIKQKDIVIFSRQLSVLFQAQIPVLEALKTLSSETAKSSLKKTINEILDDVAGGTALSQAMGKHPRAFSAFYVNLIRSGEEAGKLQEIFEYLADYLERNYYLTTKARNAMIYPAFILAVFLAVLVIMLVVVFPRLASVLEGTGQALPFYTLAIIAASTFLRQWGIILLLLLGGAGVGLYRWAQTKDGKLFFHRLQLSVPIIGGLYKKIYLAQMTDNLQTLFMSGIPLIRALSITQDIVSNVIYKHAIEAAIESVKAGSSISAAFANTPEIPPLTTQMIRIGETSGRLDFILKNLAKFYSREVDSLLENLVALIEPMLIVVLGGGVAIMVASVLVPIYNLVGNS